MFLSLEAFLALSKLHEVKKHITHTLRIIENTFDFIEYHTPYTINLFSIICAPVFILPSFANMKYMTHQIVPPALYL